MTDKRKDCQMRHENGNCTVAGGFCTSVNDPICEALHNAYDCGYMHSALREQEERENPKPLTQDELKLMDGEPVWLLPDRKCFIVNNDFQLPYGERIPCGVDMWGAGTGLSLLARCGVYRSKPKEYSK